ncbi:Protein MICRORCHIDIA 4 [Dichanthelium oligosanthes]|uniref:Protein MICRORCHIDIA 4 n=1 Tax=Dichanthelium oligosanthes TaxID=888268 RepID=A0A1E5VII9_9POAL|nr:Protein MICRORCHIDIA 4 [Dichanthelium oligosanthes]
MDPSNFSRSLMSPTLVKTEAAEERGPLPRTPAAAGGNGWTARTAAAAVIDLSSSDSDSDGEGEGGSGKRARGAGGDGSAGKRARVSAAVVVPPGFLEPIPPPPPVAPAPCATKQFWKAGDYDGKPLGDGVPQPSASGMDHVRVHPRFLHSNATSHKWALGALAELLDNSLDEVINGATYVNIDMLENNKDSDKEKSRMLLVEDDGGGMDPDKMRQCMSLGYSAKSKIASTIGQYGNGFKTSTMRLGADVLVFSRSRGKSGKRPTQSIGMLSYTFLRSTGKEDLIVPMIDYEYKKGWERMVRTTLDDWNTSLRTIITWSPYSTEAELLEQFSSMKEQGTRIIIYNLWEDDQGDLELDFDADIHDIQLRGGNRDEKNIQMANQFPNSKHYLTYRHSLRSYASILYLRLPNYFQMILRGKEIEHHNIVTDMMLKKEMVADVTIGFVKDAKHHIGPFWRVWTAAGSGGRGVIENSPENTATVQPSPYHSGKGYTHSKDFHNSKKSGKASTSYGIKQRAEKSARTKRFTKSILHGVPDSDGSDSEFAGTPSSRSRSHTLDTNQKSFQNGSIGLTTPQSNGLTERERVRTKSQSLDPNATSNRELHTTDEYEILLKKLRDENSSLKERLSKVEESMSQELVMERDKNKSLTERVEDLQRQLESATKEQEALIDIFSEERNRRDLEEDSLRKKLKDASATIQDLLEQLNAARKGRKV